MQPLLLRDTTIHVPPEHLEEETAQYRRQSFPWGLLLPTVRSSARALEPPREWKRKAPGVSRAPFGEVGRWKAKGHPGFHPRLNAPWQPCLMGLTVLGSAALRQIDSPSLGPRNSSSLGPRKQPAWTWLSKNVIYAHTSNRSSTEKGAHRTKNDDHGPNTLRNSKS